MHQTETRLLFSLWLDEASVGGPLSGHDGIDVILYSIDDGWIRDPESVQDMKAGPVMQCVKAPSPCEVVRVLPNYAALRRTVVLNQQ